MKISAARLKRLIADVGRGGNEKVVGNKPKRLYLLRKTQRDNQTPERDGTTEINVAMRIFMGCFVPI